MDNNLKVNELAALFGVTARTISDLAKRGIIARQRVRSRRADARGCS
jgi:phage terminase Nu1 subunit (DNA packaging protein)